MERITVQIPINEPIEKVWTYYTDPKHITKWAFADDSWHAPRAENDFRVGGRFKTRMEAKDGSAGFDFSGIYTNVVPPNPSNASERAKIAYTMDGDDKRSVAVEFEEFGTSTIVVVTFDPEMENPLEMQRVGWQAILDNLKKYVERG